MPIEFRCTQCQKLLRVPDETAGRQAKCPACDTVLTIPSTTTASYGDAPAPPVAAAFNPYQSPTAAVHVAGPAFQPGARVFQPTRIDAMDVLTRTWAIYKAKMGITMGVVILAFVLQMVLQFAMNPVLMAVQVVTSNPFVLFAVQMVSMVALTVFNLWIGLGLKVALLKLARGEEPAIADIFRGGQYLPQTLLAGLVVVLIVAGIAVPLLVPGLIAMAMLGPNDPVSVGLLIGGAVLFFIPYIFVLLTVSPFMYLIVDRNVDALESLSLSRTIVSGNRLHLALVWVLGSLIYLAGFVACCVGVIFTLPLFTLALTVAYLSMTGQPTIESFARGVEPAAPA